MGLLDQFFGNADQTRALGLLGAGMMNGGFAKGAPLAMEYMAGAPDREMKRRMGLLQLQEAEQKMQDAERQRAFLANLPDPGFAAGQSALVGGGGPTTANASRIPAISPTHQMLYQGVKAGAVPIADYLKAVGPTERINKLDAKDFTPESVQRFNQSGNYADLVRLDKLHFADTGGSVTGLNPFTGQRVGGVEKTGNPFNDLILSDGTGGFRPNAPLVAAKQGIAKAGAARTDVRIENKMGDSLAKEIGPIMNDSAAAATGAAQQIDAAQRIIQAVDSNKIFAGPGASIRLKTAQIGELIGAGGKDSAEKIANTRATIRGLAEMTLQGRKQMRGQGAVTESESKLAERAISGDIDDLTAAEIKQLANASARSARFIYGEHQKKLNVVRGNPNMSQLAPFYEAQPMPEAPPTTPAPAVPTMRWNPQTRKLEPM